MAGTYVQQIASRVRALVPPELLPDENTDALFLTYAVLVLARGEAVTAADVHNAWAAWMSQIDSGHESIRPFEDLPAEVRREDTPYVQAIRVAAKELAARNRAVE